MGRRWIMVELGEHCHTLIIPRLQKVIDGEDNGGITQTINCQGSGFRYYRLAPSLLEPRQMGQLGDQQNLQRCHAHRSSL
jgi:adenine-specific DNA-methyltransferase